MNPKQQALYWREWAQVRAKRPEADRHALHTEALGCDKSHKDFTNEDFDKVLGVFRAASEPDNLDAQLLQLDQPRRRLAWKIQQLAPEAYRNKIMLARFGTTRLADLDPSQLTQLRNTLAARSNALRQRTRQPETEQELAAAQGVDRPF